MIQSLLIILSFAFPLCLLWYINKRQGKTVSIYEYVIPLIIGALVDGICILIEKFGIDSYIFTGIPESICDCFLFSFFRCAFIEEIFKLLGVCVLLLLYKDKPINNILLFFIGIAVGFSMVENVVNISLASNDDTNVVAFFLGRIGSTFVHVALCIFSAFFITKFWNTSRLKCFTYAFLTSYLLHGAHDFIVSMQYYLHSSVAIILPSLLLFDTVSFLAAYILFRKTIINDTILMENEDDKFVQAQNDTEQTKVSAQVNAEKTVEPDAQLFNGSSQVVYLEYHWIPKVFMYLGIVFGIFKIFASFTEVQNGTVTIVDDITYLWGVISIYSLMCKRKWGLISYFIYRGVNILLFVVLIGMGLSNGDELIVDIIRLLMIIGIFFIRKKGYNVYRTAWENGILNNTNECSASQSNASLTEDINNNTKESENLSTIQDYPMITDSIKKEIKESHKNNWLKQLCRIFSKVKKVDTLQIENRKQQIQDELRHKKLCKSHKILLITSVP